MAVVGGRRQFAAPLLTFDTAVKPQYRHKGTRVWVAPIAFQYNLTGTESTTYIGAQKQGSGTRGRQYQMLCSLVRGFSGYAYPCPYDAVVFALVQRTGCDGEKVEVRATCELDLVFCFGRSGSTSSVDRAVGPTCAS